MQKNVPKYTPDFVRTVTHWAESSKREVTYAVCDDRRTLLWFANQRAVEYHPALTDRRPIRTHQTHLILDLDPPEGDAFGMAVRAARLVRQRPHRRRSRRARSRRAARRACTSSCRSRPTPMEDVAAATRAIAARAAALDPGRRHDRVPQGGPRRQGVRRPDAGRRRHRGRGLQPAGAARRAGVVPASTWDELDAVSPARLHDPHRAPSCSTPDPTAGPARCRHRRRCRPTLVDEGHDDPRAARRRDARGQAPQRAPASTPSLGAPAVNGSGDQRCQTCRVGAADEDVDAVRDPATPRRVPAVRSPPSDSQPIHRAVEPAVVQALSVPRTKTSSRPGPHDDPVGPVRQADRRATPTGSSRRRTSGGTARLSVPRTKTSRRPPAHETAAGSPTTPPPSDSQPDQPAVPALVDERAAETRPKTSSRFGAHDATVGADVSDAAEVLPPAPARSRPTTCAQGAVVDGGEDVDPVRAPRRRRPARR